MFRLLYLLIILRFKIRIRVAGMKGEKPRKFMCSRIMAMLSDEGVVV